MWSSIRATLQIHASLVLEQGARGVPTPRVISGSNHVIVWACSSKSETTSARISAHVAIEVVGPVIPHWTFT